MNIQELVDRYLISDNQNRQNIENEVGLSNLILSSLLGYMSECAVEAVRQKNGDFIKNGLIANVIEGCRQDFRDNIVGLTKLYHSCLILKLDPNKEFQKIADNTNGEGKELIEKFVKREPTDKTLQCMGLKTKYTPDFDFVQVDFDDDYLTEIEYSEVTDKKIING